MQDAAQYVVALGTTDSADQMRLAAHAIGRLRKTVLIKASSLWRSAPSGPAEQQFLNAVVVVRSIGSPEWVLRELHGIEKRLGRTRPSRRWTERAIDLDLIAGVEATGLAIERGTPQLWLPHRLAVFRRFVLDPLVECQPDTPLFDDTAAGCLERLQKRPLRLHGPAAVEHDDVVWTAAASAAIRFVEDVAPHSATALPLPAVPLADPERTHAILTGLLDEPVAIEAL